MNPLPFPVNTALSFISVFGQSLHMRSKAITLTDTFLMSNTNTANRLQYSSLATGRKLRTAAHISRTTVCIYMKDFKLSTRSLEAIYKRHLGRYSLSWQLTQTLIFFGPRSVKTYGTVCKSKKKKITASHDVHIIWGRTPSEHPHNSCIATHSLSLADKPALGLVTRLPKLRWWCCPQLSKPKYSHYSFRLTP